MGEFRELDETLEIVKAINADITPEEVSALARRLGRLAATHGFGDWTVPVVAALTTANLSLMVDGKESHSWCIGGLAMLLGGGYLTQKDMEQRGVKSR